jgi:4-amino-4-deoxy-L-arabinose transferase-like glycosyltransferase
MKPSVIWVIVLAIVFFFPFLGAVHLFDWDEINFAEAAREMLVTGNYSRVQIDYQVFTEKPPLFFWMQALSMNIFGVNEFAARFPNAVCGVCTLATLFLIGSKLKDAKFGFLWALSYLGSFLPHLYFKSGIIDPFFNLFIFLSVYFIFQTLEKYKKYGAGISAILAGSFIGLAILTKGPVGLLVPLLMIAIYWLSVRKIIVSFRNLLLCALFALLVALLWFGVETYKYGFVFIEEFTQRQLAIFSTSDAGHGQPWYYHPVVLFLGCFPIAQLALRSFVYKQNADKSLVGFRKMMLLLFWVTLILFSIVKTKIVHYSSLCYFPISFLASYHLYYVLARKINLNRITIILLAVFGILFALLLTAVPIAGMNTDRIIPYIDDTFAVANLKAKVSWTGLEILIGFSYMIAIIFSIVFFSRKRLKLAVNTLFFSTALCMLVYTRVVVPKIELYSQAAAIRFFKSLAGKNVYVNTLDYKSYAHLYYFKKPPVSNPKSYDQNWLLTGNIDKDAYFVGKIQDIDKHHKLYPQLQKIGEENGFVFYKRTVSLTE